MVCATLPDRPLASRSEREARKMPCGVRNWVSIWPVLRHPRPGISRSASQCSSSSLVKTGATVAKFIDCVTEPRPPGSAAEMWCAQRREVLLWMDPGQRKTNGTAGLPQRDAHRHCSFLSKMVSGSALAGGRLLFCGLGQNSAHVFGRQFCVLVHEIQAHCLAIHHRQRMAQFKAGVTL